MIESPKLAEDKVCIWAGKEFQIYIHVDTNAIEINRGGYVKVGPVESYFDPGGGISIPAMPGGSSYPKEPTWKVPKEMLVTEKISEGNNHIRGSKPEQPQVVKGGGAIDRKEGYEPSGTEWILIRNGLYYFVESNSGKIVGFIEHSPYDDCYTASYSAVSLGKFLSKDHAKKAVCERYTMKAAK